MKKRGLTILTSCFLLLTSYFLLPLNAQDKKHAAGFIVDASGDCRVLREDGREARVRTGAFVYEKETLKTGRRAYIKLVFSNGVETRLRQNSEMSVMSVPPEERGVSNKVRMVIGGMFSRVTRRKTKFDVHTPVVTIAVRGTEFDTDVGSGGETKVKVFKGLVKLSNEYGTQELKENEKSSIGSGSAPATPVVMSAEETKVEEEEVNELVVELADKVDVGGVVSGVIYVKDKSGDNNAKYKGKITIGASGDLEVSMFNRKKWQTTIEETVKESRVRFDVRGVREGRGELSYGAKDCRGGSVSMEVQMPAEKTLNIKLKEDGKDREFQLKFKLK